MTIMGETAKFLLDLDVSTKALELLTGKCTSAKQVEEDLDKLKAIYQDMPYDVTQLPNEFHTYLWTLLGEISIPNSLGEAVPARWPMLVFPFALHEEFQLHDYLAQYGFVVEKREKLLFNEVLHACLYGGQAWFESLRSALNEKTHSWGEPAVLLWVAKGPNSTCSLAAIARRAQLQLRPSMTSYQVKREDLLYPGVIKAFHTPNLGNIAIHSLLLNLEEWKC
ncbi:hypothetical protein [Neobacillus sp. Marseille-QA0830]